MTFTINALKTQSHSHGVFWSCNLLFNGVKVATVEQMGRGGQDDYTWNDPSVRAAYADFAEVYNNTHPDSLGFGEKYSKYHPEQPDPDFCAGFIESLMQEFEVEAQIKRMAKKYVLLIMPGKTRETYSRVNVAPTPENIARVQAKYPDAQIINKVS